MDLSGFDQRPIVIAIAGPNGAGKSTFFHVHLASAGLRFVNADDLADELELAPYDAARVADALRRELVRRRESFIFETVFSDPVGDKVTFLKRAAESEYCVVLCYVGVSSANVSEERVAIRVSQGGHDVPAEKLRSRYPRTLENLKAAIRELPHVLIYDNDDLGVPYRLVAAFEEGRLVTSVQPLPGWLQPVVA